MGSDAPKRPLDEGTRSPPRKRPGTTANIQKRPLTKDPAVSSPSQASAATVDRPVHPPQRGVENIVREHYNSVPERGKQWRNQESKIIGLRSFNNWVKSVCINKATTDVPRHQGNVLDIGCGKGGDLQKWAAVNIANYIGLDIADQSVEQARKRYEDGAQKRRLRFRADFSTKDCFGSSIGDVRPVADIGFDESADVRWGGGGFDVVSIMFVMHYAFETEQRARQMLKNVSSALKKGGKFVGVIPNSDVIAKHLTKGEKEWGNEIYKVRFPGEAPEDGVFRPPYGWKYMYWLEEAVDAPEYVIPWFAFRALAEDFNLELQYQKPFNEIWEEERDDPEFGKLAERMRVKDHRGELKMTKDELDAASLYHAFIFYKV